MESNDRTRRVGRVLAGVLLLNVAVSAAKIAYGAVISSVSMMADGFHSLFDGASNVIGLLGVAASRKPADASHPYGHAKYETWASLGIGLLLGVTAWQVGRGALARLADDVGVARVDAGAFVVMGVTLAVNLSVSWFERRRGRALGSEILLADASHTASDVFVSTGVIVGLLLVRAGIHQADAWVALGVALMIARAAYKVFRRAEATFSDEARLPVDAVCEAAAEVDGVRGCHDVRTRGLPSSVYVDLHVQVDPGRSLRDAHSIAERVERHLCETFSEVADVIVHVEPFDEYQAGKTRLQAGRGDGDGATS